TLTGLKTPQAIARSATCSPGTVKSLGHVGAKLDTLLPETRRLLAEGLVSFEHAKVMARCCNPRIETEFSALEAELIGQAEAMVFNRWADWVRDIARTLDQDGAYDPDQDLARNRLALHFGLDDLDALGVAGQFVGEHRLIVDHA